MNQSTQSRASAYGLRSIRALNALLSRSRLNETKAVGDEYAAIAMRAQAAINSLWNSGDGADANADKLTLERALKLALFHPTVLCRLALHHVWVRPWASPMPSPSAAVSLKVAMTMCRLRVFYLSGDMAEILSNVGRTQ